ncbi:MAG: hypothetical protein RLZZ458_2573, partial [Planctomycetota bacterium]
MRVRRLIPAFLICFSLPGIALGVQPPSGAQAVR